MIQYQLRNRKQYQLEVGMGKEEEPKQSISDDQELAKVLAGIGNNDNAAATTPLQPTAQLPPVPPMPPVDTAQPVVSTDDQTLPTPTLPAAEVDENLDSIKKEALGELRPLVDKLNVEPDEKFDIYLLMLRSTDDKELIAPAHEAAKAITDEAKRAQALLDVIKEIDFLSQPPATEAAAASATLSQS
jgi:hypothetical protein